MRHPLSLFLVIISITVSSCATTGMSTYVYNPPTRQTIRNEILLPDPFETVWDRLVRRLSTSFFVINNIDKSSRLINVSFSTDKPQDYIDCGTSHRTYKRGSDEVNYTYQVAESKSYKIASKGGELGNLPVTYYVDRRTSLEGRMNIYVAPQGDSTLVSVNCKYVFTASTSGSWTMEDVLFLRFHATVVQQSRMDPRSSSLSFSTGQPQTANWGTADKPSNVTGVSTGRLEAEILGMARSSSE